MTNHTDSSKEIEIPKELQNWMAQQINEFAGGTVEGRSFMTAAFILIYRHLRASHSPSGWINTNDRLPESGEYVLAFDRIWKTIVEQSWEEYTDHTKEWFHTKFSHWMPLPPRPTTSGDRGMNL